MSSIKCATCGLVLWATEETCKRCGSTIYPKDNGRRLSQASTVFTDKREPGEISRRIRNRLSKRWWLLTVAVLVMLALPATWLGLRALNFDQPQVFVLRKGKKAVSRAWFHSWFASDPSGDEIFDHYLKISGWQDHSQDLKSYIANGPFQIRNEATQTIARDKYNAFLAYGYMHWTTCGGYVDLKGEGRDKLLITQQYNDCVYRRTWQRGTNGRAGWSRKAGLPPASQESSSPEPPRGELADLYDPLSDLPLNDLKRGAEFVNYLQLQTRQSGLYLDAKSMVGDRVCYEVHSKPALGPAEVMYFDVETGLLLKFEHDRPEFPYVPFFDGYILAESVPSRPAETYLENYQEVNGIQIPFLVRQHLHDLWITMTISEFKANPEITASEFEKPSK